MTGAVYNNGVLTGRLGIKSMRTERILHSFHSRALQTEALIHKSFLPLQVQDLYFACLTDKLRRLL